jgi:dephospho-CoA kinase
MVVRLGITGGIGSGKSTVAAFLKAASQGVLLDADHISRQLTSPGGAALPALQEVLGPSVIDATGGLDRNYVRQRAFIDDAFRKTLEAVIHPLVQQEMARIEDECRGLGTGALVIYDIPLLVESNKWRRRLDRVLVVDCSESTQIERVQARSQLSAAEIKSIIAAQANRNARLSSADLVVFNERISLSELEKTARQISNILGLQQLAKDSA